MFPFEWCKSCHFCKISSCKIDKYYKCSLDMFGYVCLLSRIVVLLFSLNFSAAPSKHNTNGHEMVSWSRASCFPFWKSITMTLLQYTLIIIHLRNYLMRAWKHFDHFKEVFPSLLVSMTSSFIGIFKFWHNSRGHESTTSDMLLSRWQ